MPTMGSDWASLIAVFALALIAAALFCAGLYALFGKPSTHEGKERKRHIVHGFQLGGGILLGIALMGAAVLGTQLAFGIIESSKLSRVAGLAIALISLLLIFLMLRRWATHFAGWVGYSVWNGLRMLSTGRALNSSIPVPRWWSGSATLLMFLSALVCVRFTKRYVLNGADKVALMTWLVAFIFAIDVAGTPTVYRDQLGLVGMSIGCLAVVLAWWHWRMTRHHRAHTPHMHPSAEQNPP